MLLTLAGNNSSVKIRNIGGKQEVRHHLENLGICPGMNILIVKKGDVINKDKLEKELGVKAIFTYAINKKGVEELIDSLGSLKRTGSFFLSKEVEASIAEIENIIASEENLRM